LSSSSISRRAACSESRFHSRSNSTVKRSGASSTSLACIWQSQIPFSADPRSSFVKCASYLFPPFAAAVMCAATPTSTVPSELSPGPAVRTRQFGFEHRYPTRRARRSLTDFGKSSRADISYASPLVGEHKRNPRGRDHFPKNSRTFYRAWFTHWLAIVFI
jgi:hypothetical protein